MPIGELDYDCIVYTDEWFVAEELICWRTYGYHVKVINPNPMMYELYHEDDWVVLRSLGNPEIIFFALRRVKEHLETAPNLGYMVFSIFSSNTAFEVIEHTLRQDKTRERVIPFTRLPQCNEKFEFKVYKYYENGRWKAIAKTRNLYLIDGAFRIADVVIRVYNGTEEEPGAEMQFTEGVVDGIFMNHYSNMSTCKAHYTTRQNNKDREFTMTVPILPGGSLPKCPDGTYYQYDDCGCSEGYTPTPFLPTMFFSVCIDRVLAYNEFPKIVFRNDEPMVKIVKFDSFEEIDGILYGVIDIPDTDDYTVESHHPHPDDMTAEQKSEQDDINMEEWSDPDYDWTNGMTNEEYEAYEEANYTQWSSSQISNPAASTYGTDWTDGNIYGDPQSGFIIDAAGNVLSSSAESTLEPGTNIATSMWESFIDDYNSQLTNYSAGGNAPNIDMTSHSIGTNIESGWTSTTDTAFNSVFNQTTFTG